jgi:hypothetical protein
VDQHAYGDRGSPSHKDWGARGHREKGVFGLNLWLLLPKRLFRNFTPLELSFGLACSSATALGAKKIVMPPFTMQAMVLDRAAQPLREVELPVPAPGPDQILIKVAACRVCRTDLHASSSIQSFRSCWVTRSSGAWKPWTTVSAGWLRRARRRVVLVARPSDLVRLVGD